MYDFRKVRWTIIRSVWLVCLVIGCSPLRRDETSTVTPGLDKIVDFISMRPKLFQREPTLNRPWRPDLAVLPTAEFEGNRVVIHNVRNCRYRTEDDYDTRHYDIEFELGDVERVDFIIVPFKGNRLLAHTMLSFGLRDGRHFVLSVEARLAQGETYTTVSGPGKKYELMYLIADERDVLPLRTEVRQVDVHLYRGRTTPEQAQKLLVDSLYRANKLAHAPEFYDILRNNCTTNLVDHINKLRPGAIPFDWRVVLPGHSDSLAYELGLLDIDTTFEVAQKTSRINGAVHLYKDDPDFSKRIRRE